MQDNVCQAFAPWRSGDPKSKRGPRPVDIDRDQNRIAARQDHSAIEPDFTVAVDVRTRLSRTVSAEGIDHSLGRRAI